MVKELDRSKLTIEQKLGQLICANLNHGEWDVDNAVALVKEHKLGAIWIQPNDKNREERVRRILEAADYPILVFCDAEEGADGYTIPQGIVMTAARQSEELAYSFGRITATAHRKMGYNVICNPIVDIPPNRSGTCGGNTRGFGPSKEDAATLGAAVARGMKDAGIMAVAKHFPGSGWKGDPVRDSHMCEGFSSAPLELIKEKNLYPYRELAKEGLIDGVMVGHQRFASIDPERPASLSKPAMDLLREDVGFDGFVISDALNMMGIVLKYGEGDPIAMFVEAGGDLPLPWGIDCKKSYDYLVDAYHRGVVSDEAVEKALTRVLAAQHKAANLPPIGEILPEDEENIHRLHRECVSAFCAEGLLPHVSREGHHLFTLATDASLGAPPEDYTPGPTDWFFPHLIVEKIRELFPNSDVESVPIFPTTRTNMYYLDKQTKYDDIVFITFYQSAAYIGREHLTTRLVDLMDALQTTDRIVAHLHFGNPFVATDAPFVPRVLLGYTSHECVMHTLDILAGKAEAVGYMPYTLNFHKKGDVFQ